MRVGTARGLAAIAIGLVLTGPAGAREAWRHTPVRADSPVCSATYARAVDRAREARLKEASELFAVCARASCGEATRRECLARHAQLDADTPTLVPLVSDDAGEPRVLVEVRIDGELATSRLDGRALPVDPGKHELTFSTDSGVFATRRLMAVQGERNRAIHVVLHAADEGRLRAARELMAVPPPLTPTLSPPSGEREGDGDVRAARAATAPEVGAPEVAAPEVAAKHVASHEGRGAAPYLFGALGLAGVGGFGLLTYWGRADNTMLAECSPRCTNGSVLHVRELYWAADASLGVGLASLAISTWLFASHHPAEAPPEVGAVSLGVHPTRQGGVASIAGRF